MRDNEPSAAAKGEAVYGTRHVAFGWWALLVFLSVGIGLEAFHALKLGWYLDVENETRRLQFTLGHAHGTLLAIVNIAFGVCLKARCPEIWQRYASQALISSTILMPSGFILGGVFIHAGDPGIGIVLAPVGGALFLVGVLLTAIGLTPARTRSLAVKRWLSRQPE